MIETYDEELEKDLVTDKDFVESFAAKARRRKQDSLLDLGYREEEVKILNVYPLTTLTGKDTINGIRVSNEKTTLMITTPDKGKKVKSYFEEIANYDLNEFVDPATPTEQLIKNSSNINITTFDFKEANFSLLYLMTFEPITNENFASIKKYLGKTITNDLDSGQTNMTFVPIEEFSSLFKSQPIKVILSEPITEKIKSIKIKSPDGTLIGNIKAIDEKGHISSLIADENTEVFPKLVFPFQTEPRLATVEYWASKQIIPLKEIFDFLDSKNIAYDQEFSLADFLKLGISTTYPPIHLDNVQRIRFRVPKIKYEQALTGTAYGGVENDLKEYFDFDINKAIRLFLTKLGSGKEPWIHSQIDQPENHDFELPGGIGTRTVYTKNFRIEQINDVDIYPIDVGKNTEPFDVICMMLTESFWKDMEFYGATKILINGDPKAVVINDAEIYKLQEKYSGQDRYSVTTNLWIAWKRKNPNWVNANPEIIKRIENSIAMLSGVIKSNYSINKGDNDDYKILLPYYFELQNKLDNPDHWVKYQDIVVKLKSSYGEFTKDKFVFNNKNISNSKIFELEYNHFVFPELTKNVEIAMIPSSMPLDQQLANGEYSKYLMINFSNDDEKRKIYLNKYGSGVMENDAKNENIDNQGDFDLAKPIAISELKIASFFGYGTWNFVLIDEKDAEFKIDIELFSKFDDTKTLISLITS